MAVTTRVRRIANPRRQRARANPQRRRKMTAKQIKFFGTKRQRAGLKANRKRKRANPKAIVRHRRRTVRSSNPRPRGRVRTVTKTVVKYRTRRAKPKTNRQRPLRRNPAPVILTLGATNPRRTMAKRKKENTRYTHWVKTRMRSRNPRRVARRTRRNPPRRVTMRRRTASRNPLSLFGGTGMKHTTEVVGGVLAGMAGTKFVPTLVPASLSAMGGSTFGPVIISGVAAFVLKKAAEMIKKGAFSDGVFLGGLAQTGSVLLNALVPSIWGQFGVSGLGALIPGRFPVPQNPVTAGRQLGAASGTQVSGTGARIGVSGMGRAFGSAF